MKKIGLCAMLLLAAVTLPRCTDDYDDTELRTQIGALEARIEALEQWCDRANGQIGALQGLVSALEEKDYVTGVVPVLENGKQVGYTITFTQSGAVTILNGKDGAAGTTPVVGAKQDSDGKYYWTVKTGDAEPEWMTDEQGGKIPAAGTSPELGVAEFEGALYWQIDGEWLLHEGAKVPATGERGDAVFAEEGIDLSDPANVTFTLADGLTKITLPRVAGVTVGFDSYDVFYGSAGNREIALLLPETLREEDYTAITATVTCDDGVSADVATRAADDEKWGVKVTKPTFANGAVVAGSARVTLTPPADVKLSQTALLQVTITDAKGRDYTVSRPVKYFEGQIVTCAAGGLSGAVADPAVTKLAVKGSLDAADLGYIRQSLTALEVLDLSMTDLAAMPDRALAFYDTPNTTLRRVVLPNCMASIGEAAFANCKALQSIDLRSVATLGKWVFENCASLREVLLGDRLREIPNSLFLNCTSLASIEIPGNVETLGRWVFEKCEALETVILNEGIRNLSPSTFYGCGVVSLRIPSTVTAIPEFTFQNCTKLERITLHDGIRSIGAAAFNLCRALRQFKVPAGVTVLPDNLFEACSSLQFVEFHDGVTELGERAFANCNSLRGPADRTSWILPASLSVLGPGVFMECTGLTNVTMSDAQVRTLSSDLFMGCTSLNYVELPKNLEQIDPWAFSHCYALASIGLPATVTALGDHAFHLCRKLEMVICRAQTPPAADATTFDPEYKANRSLLVPAGADYTAWETWFKGISQMP